MCNFFHSSGAGALVLEFMFWASVVLIVYTYAGYPLLIGAAAWLRSIQSQPRPSPSLPQDLPLVSVCIAVRNEGHRIAAKLANLRSLDYPRDRLDIVISSDGSTDSTSEILRDEPGVRFVEGPQGGKVVALTRAVEASRGSIIVFADARQALSSNAIHALVTRLQDEEVGAVSGLLKIVAPQGEESRGADMYWRYESMIRRYEGRYFSLVGASGALYAMRRVDIQMPEPGTILDDFEIPIQVLRQGRRIVLEDSAVALDTVSAAPGSEAARKIRTLAGNFQSFLHQPWLFSPFGNPVWWQFISHKVLRLVVPYLMLLALAGSGMSDGWLYRAAFAGQAAFYVAALSGLCWPALRRLRPVNIASTFVDLNYSAVKGMYYFVSGKSHLTWKTTSRPEARQ